MDKIKVRDQNPDIIKGIGILLVIIYHLVYRAKNGTMDQLIRESIWLYMPLYFLLSGYYFRLRDESIGKQIGIRLKKLLVSVLVACFIVLLIGGIYCLIVHDYSMFDWGRDALFTFLRPEFSTKLFPDWGDVGLLFWNLSQVWFIWTMVWSYVFFIPLASYVLGHIKREIVAIVVLLGVQVPLYLWCPPLSWSLNLVPIYMVIMLIGKMLSEYHIIEWLVTLWPILLFVIALACFTAHFVLFQWAGTDWVYAGKIGGLVGGTLETLSGWEVLIFPLQTLIGGFAFFALAELLSHIRFLARALAWVGRHTITFLMYHAFFSMFMTDILNTYFKIGPNWYLEKLTTDIIVKSWIVTLVCIAGCSCMSFLHDKIFGVRKARWMTPQEMENKAEQAHE